MESDLKTCVVDGISYKEIDARNNTECTGCAGSSGGDGICFQLPPGCSARGTVWIRDTDETPCILGTPEVEQAEAVKYYLKNYTEESDLVNSPPHYADGGLECIDYIQQRLTEEEFRGYLRGNMIKYQHRLMAKGNPKMDAEKIGWYCNRLIQEL